MKRRAALVNLTLVVLVAACSSQAPISSPDTTATSTPTSSADTVATSSPGTDPATTGSPPSGGGWIGGEPDWSSHASGGSASGESDSAMAAPSPASGTDREAVAETSSAETAAEMPVEPIEPTSQGGLRAGSVDDNADYAAFLEYVARIHDLGITTRAFDPTGRVVVTVTGSSGLPVAGAAVTVTDGQNVIAELRTTADGTARFLPALYGAAAVASFSFTSEGVSAEAAPGGAVTLTVPSPGGAIAPVALDVLFLLDATGSMGDEIDRLKTTIDEVASRVAAFETRPDVRFAFTLYRDEDDLFVTKTFDFTGNIDEFRQALAVVTADGGGDYPEALEEGFAEALAAPSWREAGTAVQLMFLVGDAPPRLDRQVPVDYPAAIVDAVSRGIKVFPIASSESDDQAEVVFRSIAAATGARFVFLSYGAAGAATGASTDIAPTDYEEMALDELVVRFIAEELAALTGQDQGVPPTTTPPTVTNPDGQ